MEDGLWPGERLFGGVQIAFSFCPKMPTVAVAASRLQIISFSHINDLQCQSDDSAVGACRRIRHDHEDCDQNDRREQLQYEILQPMRQGFSPAARFFLQS
jgi:hypothetical protein